MSKQLNRMSAILLVLFIVSAGVAAYSFINPPPGPTQTVTKTATVAAPTVTVTSIVGATGAAQTITMTQTATVTATATTTVAGAVPSIEELAKKEGKVLMYTVLGPANMQPAFDLFTKKYGIKIEAVHLEPQDVYPRVVSEYAAGRFDVDIINGGVPEVLLPLGEEGYLMQFESKEIANFPKASSDPANLWFPLRISATAPAYNKEKFKPEDLKGQNWDTLATDPRWKGKIGLRDLDKGGNLVLFSMLYKVMGEAKAVEWAKNLIRNQKPLIHPDEGFLTQAMIRGEIDLVIGIPDAPFVRYIAAKNPIEVLGDFPNAGSGQVSGQAIARKAPHPNAAKLLMEFMLSKEGQAAMGKLILTLRTDVTPEVPYGKIIKNIVVLPPREAFILSEKAKVGWKTIKAELGL